MTILPSLAGPTEPFRVDDVIDEIEFVLTKLTVLNCPSLCRWYEGTGEVMVPSTVSSNGFAFATGRSPWADPGLELAGDSLDFIAASDPLEDVFSKIPESCVKMGRSDKPLP
jgi:hypothetical protein